MCRSCHHPCVRHINNAVWKNGAHYTRSSPVSSISTQNIHVSILFSHVVSELGYVSSLSAVTLTWPDGPSFMCNPNQLNRIRTNTKVKVKVKWSRYRPGVAQRVGRGIALLFHDRGTRRGWVVSSTHRPHFTPGKDKVPILQEAGWAPGLVWSGGKSHPHRG